MMRVVNFRIKSIYVASPAFVRVKGDENKCFIIESGVRQGFIMSPWLFIVYMDAVIENMKMGIGRMGVKFMIASPFVCRWHSSVWRVAGGPGGDGGGFY